MAIAAIPDWLDSCDTEKPYVEQIRGRREAKVSPKRRHALLQGRIFTALDQWAGDRGEVGTEWRCYLIAGEDRPSSLVPDVAFFSFARLPPALEDDARERPRIAPDIAVEILSPGDRRRTLEEKIGLYLAHGSSLVIVLDPETRTAALHRPDGSALHETQGTLALRPFDGLALDWNMLFRGL